MKRSLGISFLLLMLVPVALSGCVVLAVGAGAAGGYAISRDTIEGFTDKDSTVVWQAAQEVLKKQGMIELADKTAGKIQARIEDSEVKFETEQVTTKSVRIRVRARKFWNAFPDMHLAQRIYTLIINEIKS